MEQHVVGLIVLIAVAVDTLAYRIVVHGNLVIENLCLFERGEIALGNLHVSPCNIRGFDETIRQIFVNGLFGYLYLKRIKRQPFAVFLSPDLNPDALAF